MSSQSDELNFQPRHVDGVLQQDARITEASLEQVREMLDQTRNNLLRTQRRIERNEKQAEALGRQMRVLWVMVIMALLGFGLLTLYQVVAQKAP